MPSRLMQTERLKDATQRSRQRQAELNVKIIKAKEKQNALKEKLKDVEVQLKQAKCKVKRRAVKIVEEDFPEKCQEAYDEMTFYRKKMTDFNKRLQKELTDKKIQLGHTHCEVCHQPFKATGQSVPRVMDCGHTLCESCIRKVELDYSRQAMCPFDRTIFRSIVPYEPPRLPVNNIAINQ